jgi:excisionase family DNA binding protein
MRARSTTKATFFAPEPQQTGELLDFIEAHTKRHSEKPETHFYLSGGEVGDQVEIPHEIYEVLAKVVEAMRQGLAITVTPSSHTLTTQQAAEVLGVTRPTLVKLLDENKIPFEKPATHRRVKLEDVLSYKEARKREQYEALASMGEPDDTSPEEALANLKRARKIAAQRRSSKP